MVIVGQLDWALVGPGAVGLNYGAKLAAIGEKVHILARSDRGALRSQGIVVSDVNPKTGELRSELAVRPESVATDASEIGKVDAVLIAAKSTVNEQLIDPLAQVIEPGRTIILTLQNGMGNAEFYAKHFPENPILAGLCFVCANRVAPGVVENYHPGRVEFGSLGDHWGHEAASMTEIFKKAGVRANCSPVLDSALWRKLCWNVPFNGLSIACGAITCDQILGNKDHEARAWRLMREVQHAAAAHGHEIPDSFLQGQFDVTKKMGAYQPSSLIDFVEQRAVEVDAIWGEPLRRGEAAGLAMSELSELYQEINLAVSNR